MKNLFFVVAMLSASVCFASSGDCANGQCRRPVASVAQASAGVVGEVMQASAAVVGEAVDVSAGVVRGVAQTGSCVVSKAVTTTRSVAKPVLRPVRRVLNWLR